MAKIYKRGTSYYLTYYDASGKRHRPCLGRISEADAEAARTAIERELAGTCSAAGPRFADFAVTYSHWRADAFPSSYYRVEGILRLYLIPFFGHIPIGQITKEDVRKYQRERSRVASAATVIKETRALQAVLNWAVDEEAIAVNKARKAGTPQLLDSKPPRYYSRDELLRIYERDPLHAAIWRLLANTGLRRGEASQLRRKDITSDTIYVVSTEAARTKSAKWRIVPITPGARLALDTLPKSGDLVLPPMTRESMTRAFAKTLKRVGLDGSLHCLRHTYCSHLVMQGVPLRTVQKLAGHSTIKITENYAHLSPEHLRDATRKLDL